MKREAEKSIEQRMQDSRDEKRRLENLRFIAAIIFGVTLIIGVIALLLWARDTAITSIAERIAP